MICLSAQRGLLASLVALTCSGGCNVTLEGAPCPCGEGWFCCETQQVCVKDRRQCAACGDARCEGEESCGSCPGDCGPCDLIPADRRIDWEPGLPEGIPARAVICASVKDTPYGARGDGVSDDSAAIQAALDACPAQQVVQLPAGSYRVTRRLFVPGSITLRGEGPGRTIIDAQGTQQTAVISFGRSPGPAASAVDIKGGASRGSRSLTLAAPLPASVGEHFLVDELNDPDLVTSTGYNGSCTWCGREAGARARGQILEVTGLADGGRSVTFTPPLYASYSLARRPQAVPLRMAASWAGVEDLTVRANDTGAGSSFLMDQCAYCWLRNVEGDYTDGDHVRIQSSYRCEVRDSYFHDAFHRRPGETHDDISLSEMTTASLVENNLLYRLYVGVRVETGATGNVVAYNYLRSLFSEDAPDAVGIALSLSGAHTAFNLWEGNVGARLSQEGGWGSSSHDTLFRNWLSGTDTACAPLTGRAPLDPTSCRTLFQQAVAVNLGYTAQHHNVIGNVLGASSFRKSHCLPRYGQTGACQPIPPGKYMIVATVDPSVYEAPYVFRLGYAGAGGGSNPLESHRTFETLFNHGNWDFVSGSIKWAPRGPTGIPASLYRTARPAWFGDRPWPPIEPGRSPGTIDDTVIPAGYRFAHGAAPPGAR